MSRTLRAVALTTTLLMSLANLPVGFTATDADVPHWVQWPATGLGVLGIIAFVAMLRRARGSVLAVLAVAVVNVVAASLVMADGHPEGVVGLVLGGLAALVAATTLSRSEVGAPGLAR